MKPITSYLALKHCRAVLARWLQKDKEHLIEVKVEAEFRFRTLTRDPSSSYNKKPSRWIASSTIPSWWSLVKRSLLLVGRRTQHSPVELGPTCHLISAMGPGTREAAH